MPETKSIADVIGTGAGVQPHEAVAIIQQLITSVEGVDVELPRQGPLSLGDLRLGSDGSVVCRAGAATPSIVDIAELFEAMLPRGGRTHVPGALRYTVARALREVDAPRFNSMADFSAALKRHEQGDRHTVLRELYSRTAAVDPRVVPVGDERRGPALSTPELSRQRREADTPLYLSLISERPVERRPVTAPPPIDPATIELIPEPRLEPPIGSAGFSAWRWILGGAAALVMSFGAGYTVVDRMTPHAARSPVTASRSPAAVARADLSGPRADADTAYEIGPTTADPADVDRNGPARSVYTPLIGRNCTMTKEDKNTGSFVKVCPGVAGSRLLIASDDDRMSVTVVTEDEREHPLDYPEVIAPGVSRLGTQAEWRIIYRDGKVTPIALIVRVYAEDNDSRSPKRTSYLAVAKLTSTEICVTDRIPAAARANEQARRASVASATRACLKPVFRALQRRDQLIDSR